MAKYSFQDIKVSTGNKKKKKKKSDHSVTKNIHTINTNIGVYRRFSVTRRIFIWSLAIIAVVFLTFPLFNLFSGATVTLHPKFQESAIEGIFKAVKDSNGDNLTFQVMISATEESEKVPATEKREVNKKAYGSIVIYNTYSSSRQRLIKNTRFITPDGKVYRIKKSVTVPGSKVVQGKIIPGSVEVIVYADEPGEGYNIGLADFKIPGFKGSPRYEKFYARSKTKISGGFSGVINVPSENDMKEVSTKLKEKIREKLISDANLQKPIGYILYPNAVYIEFDKNVNEEMSDNFVNLTLGAKLYGLIFNEKHLAKFIAQKSLASFDGNQVHIPNLKDLNFKIQNKDSVSPFDKDFRFSLSGNVKIVWDVDEDKIKQKLTGISKSRFEDVMSKFVNIKDAKATVRPFWNRHFPKKEYKIKVETISEF